MELCCVYVLITLKGDALLSCLPDKINLRHYVITTVRVLPDTI